MNEDLLIELNENLKALLGKKPAKVRKPRKQTKAQRDREIKDRMKADHLRHINRNK